MPELFKSTCSYCGVGCGVEILKHRDSTLELRGDASHPANRGLLCSKGRSLLHTVNARSTRLHFPTMRADKNSPRERVSWDTAIARAAAEFKRIIAEHGPDAVAFYISGQCLTEEYYLANKLVKGFLGTNNIDTNSRLCMSSAVAGYKATLGADAPPISYEDIDFADTFLIAGANPAWAHPILFRRIEARKAADKNVKLILVDPRRTATAALADIHLQLRPGTDVALFLGLARHLIHTHQIDRDFLTNHTDNADAYLASCEPWTLHRTAEVCGLDPSAIARAADLLGADRRFLSMWTMGLNQSSVGTDKNIALISLSLLTGKIGKPGCGPFSLTGQPNAMGGREVGGMSNLLPAHRDLKNPLHRQQVADFWRVPTLSPTPGLTAVELFDAIGEGKVKAVWIIATNPIASLPASWNVEKNLARAELVIAQDIYPTETTDLADIILPAAGWLEKIGTMTNSDRRIALLDKVVDPPGEALPDADILLKFAHAMGWQKFFDYPTVAAIFAEHAALTAGTDIDITAVSHESLKHSGTIQWPAPATIRTPNSKFKTPDTPRLYTDHLFPTPTARAQLHPLTFHNRAEPLSPALPLILTTGRIRDHWHTMTKTGQVNRLSAHINSPFCEIHPEDAEARHITDGDILTLTNPRGEVRVRAVVTPDIRPGVVFLPMHWGKRLAGDRGRTNNLASPRVDPISKEPDLKFAAVQVERFTPPKRNILIVGAGAAALAFIEHHRRFNQHDTITLLGGEDFPVYNRVLLPHYIDGSTPWTSLIRADTTALAPHRVTFRSNTFVTAIHRADKIVVDANGHTYPYDTLILATGSRPAIHYDGPIPECGTHTLRSRSHADAIIAEAQPGKHAVIHGGGLLGLELAAALRQRGCHVTILQRANRLMGKQLDATAARHLIDELVDRHIAIRFHTSIVELVGEDKITAVRVQTKGHSDIESLPCDLFIFATGIIPNKEIAGTGGLDCDRGILINKFLQTSDPDIFAIGECAEFEGQTFGTTPAATEQAAALAQFLRGNEHAPYKPTVSANILKIKGLHLAAVGETDPLPGAAPYEEITLHDARRRHYQKLILRNDRLVGAICMGDISRFPQYLEWIATGLELEELRDTLLRPGAGAALPKGPIVCSCNQVGSITIEEAARENGCDFQKVSGVTRAGTGCGSCQPEVAALIEKVRIITSAKPVPARRTIAV